MSAASKPLLFLTGFLGAGKTTLLRSLLVRLAEEGRTADVILNDFANADLDAATLDEAAASVAPIAASCACCESLDELVALCQAAVAGEGDVLLVELNGTADPLSLLEAFTLLEEKLPFYPRLQVSVVDCRFWGGRGEYEPLERRQLETAGFWMPTHLAGAPGERVEQVAAEVGAVAPMARWVTVDELAAELEAALDEEGGTDIADGVEGAATNDGGGDLDVSPSSCRDEAHRLSHRFTGVSLPLPPRVRRRDIEALLRDLPPWVVRAKALVKLVEEPGMRWLFERAGTEEIGEPIPVPGIRRSSASLVCVGPRLDPGQIREIIGERFGAVESGGG